MGRPCRGEIGQRRWGRWYVGLQGHGARGLQPVGSFTRECRRPAFALVSFPRALRRPFSEAEDCGRSRESCAISAPPRATYINSSNFFQKELAPFEIRANLDAGDESQFERNRHDSDNSKDHYARNHWNDSSDQQHSVCSQLAD